MSIFTWRNGTIEDMWPISYSLNVCGYLYFKLLVIDSAYQNGTAIFCFTCLCNVLRVFESVPISYFRTFPSEFKLTSVHSKQMKWSHQPLCLSPAFQPSWMSQIPADMSNSIEGDIYNWLCNPWKVDIVEVQVTTLTNGHCLC